ncbi:MAG: radical SAM protein [Archaeoglobales archaeon]|nr:radical SAM protein [Archaeoglobales archaeon]
MREAKLFRKVGEKIVCQLCWRFCRIRENESGYCKVRINKNGKLYTLTYGKLSALESRPIEIKPFFHFKPSSTSMTFSTYSCNFDCAWCQNWNISKSLPFGKEVTPEYVVNSALKNKDTSLCASLNEPTLLYEFLLDTFVIGRKNGLLNTIVSNGYMSIMALKNLKRAGLDALKVDIKGGKNTYEVLEARDDYVWRIVKEALKLGIHVEIVNLVITDVNEDQIEEVIQKHLKFANQDIPIHFTRYFPAYKFRREQTRIETLERAVYTAKREGIKFAYIGNVPGHKYEHTYCPNCGEVLIKRYSYIVLEKRIKDGRCWKCGEKIYGVW